MSINQIYIIIIDQSYFSFKIYIIFNLISLTFLIICKNKFKIKLLSFIR